MEFLLQAPFPGVRIIAPSRVGHGHGTSTGAYGQFSIEDFVSDFSDFANQLGLTSFLVVGFSMGTFYALQVAAALPDRVLGVGLLASATDPLHPKASAAITKATMHKAMKHGYVTRGCFSSMIRARCTWSGPTPRDPAKFYSICKPYFSKEDAALDAEPFLVSRVVDAMHLSIEDASGTHIDMHLGRAQKWTYDVASIRCPSLFVTGTADVICPPALAEFNASVVPGAKVVLTEGAGHATLLTKGGGLASYLQQVVDLVKR